MRRRVRTSHLTTQFALEPFVPYDVQLKMTVYTVAILLIEALGLESIPYYVKQSNRVSLTVSRTSETTE
ncbi:MAG: hypothetical protein ACI9HK_005529 [Pirellulaceae bacterium]|jgi:hypothetical protein